MKRLPFILGGLLLVLLATGVRWSQPASTTPALAFDELFIAPQGEKPEQNWRVCRDLGVGDVPGLGIRRQRFRLCHSQGWEVLAYCLEPNLPAPAVGTRCTRTNANTYWCGSGLQRLREYAVQETPTAAAPPLPVPTETRLPTPTTTPAPPTAISTATSLAAAQTATPGGRALSTPIRRAQATPRVRAGGRGNFDLRNWLSLDWLAAPIKTPFQPQVSTPTPFQPRLPTALPETVTQPTPSGFYGLDLADPGHRVRILIFPPNKKVNRGNPILISIVPGQTCKTGDNRACVNTYQTQAGASATFITVHSGVGSEAQAYRHAIEGTGINSAGLSLKQVRANLLALNGAEVVILQGKRRYEGFTLVAATRIPAKFMKAYFDTPIQESLAFASSIDGSLSGLADSDLPLLIFETCGWKMPGEPWVKGVTSTTASVYLGVIQKKP